MARPFYMTHASLSTSAILTLSHYQARLDKVKTKGIATPKYLTEYSCQMDVRHNFRCLDMIATNNNLNIVAL